MKKLAILAFATLSTVAFAQSTDLVSGGGSSCTDCPEININGRSTQTVSATSSAFNNYSAENAFAVQNVSSNGGTVDINGVSSQTTTATNRSTVTNRAEGYGAYAAQNLASNTGNVTVARGATSIQRVALNNTLVSNRASANSKAVQNLATNNGCTSCQPASHHGGPR